MRYSVTRPHTIRIPIFGCGCGYEQESECSTQYIPHTTLDSIKLIPTVLFFPMAPRFAASQSAAPLHAASNMLLLTLLLPPMLFQYWSNYAVSTMLFPIMLLSLCCLPPCSSPLFCSPVLLPTTFRLNMLVPNMLLVIMQLSILLLSVIRHASFDLFLGRYFQTPPLDNE